MDKWSEAKDNGGNQAFCKKYSGISRSTYFRQKKILKELDQGITPPTKRPQRVNKPRWGEAEKQLVLKLRRENPTYGKEKIAIILKRDHGQTLSTSTVGRILKHLMEKSLIQKSPSALRTSASLKTTPSLGNSKITRTWSLGSVSKHTKNGITVKHFQAWERQSKHLFAKVFSHAKASSAKRFLMDFVKNELFKILSIQVDGGSEFMAEFEDTCADLAILVLPPAKPQYSGGVERGNRIFREEFYNHHDLSEDSIGAIQNALMKAVSKYNTYRPHFALKGLTLQYIQINHPEAFQKSQTM